MSDRKLDSKGRWRSRVVAFRVSDEEAELLNRLVDISGLTKQDYLIKKTTDHKVAKHFETLNLVFNSRIFLTVSHKTDTLF